MIIWRGWGFFVIVLPFALAISGQKILEAQYGDGSWAEHSTLGWTIVAVISAVITWFLGSWLNKDSNHNTLFFIPAQYWAFIWIALIPFFHFVYPLL